MEGRPEEECTAAESESILKHIGRDCRSAEQVTMLAVDSQFLPNKDNLELYREQRVQAHPLSNFDGYKMDTQCFPTIYPFGCWGVNEKRPVKLNHANYYRAIIQNANPTARQNLQFLFFANALKDIRKINQGVYVSSTYGVDRKGLNVGEVKSLLASRDRVLENSCSAVLGQIDNTKEYWFKREKELEAMVDELGPATWFVTITFNEFSNDYYRKGLKAMNPQWDPRWADAAHISELVAKDPVSTSRLIERYFQAVLKVILHPTGGPLGVVVDYFWRREYQVKFLCLTSETAGAKIDVCPRLDRFYYI